MLIITGNSILSQINSDFLEINAENSATKMQDFVLYYCDKYNPVGIVVNFFARDDNHTK